MKRETNEQYFDWLCEFVIPDRRSFRHYKLMEKLYSMEFVPILEMDFNRATDGLDLRRYFAYEQGCKEPLQGYPCRMLEMMIALAKRMESQILLEYDAGDRTSVWFSVMLESLGLDSVSDAIFDDQIVEYAINKFNERDFLRDGTGSLFVVRDPGVDMRRLDIWYQMCAYVADRGL